MRIWILTLFGACALAAAPARASDVSSAIAHVRAADSARLVSIVAADIDADGDLDVVGSDRALQLHVWVNDGRGHFTRREPSTAPTWHRPPGAPSVDDGASPPPTLTQVDPPTLDTTPAAAVEPVAVAPAVERHASAPTSAAHTARTPRAPPAPLA